MGTSSPVPEQQPVDFWQKTWGWRQALLIQLTVIVLAIPLQWRLAHAHLPGITPPWNWLLPAAFLLLGCALGLVFRTQRWMRWLSGAQFAITITLLVVAITLLGVLIPQDKEKTDWLARYGLRAIYTSLPFVAAILLMMLNLATVVGRRLVGGRTGYIAFMFNHVGLLLVLLAMLAGKAQFANPMLQLREGESTTTAIDETGRTYNLGAQVTLTKFDLEKFPPCLAVEQYIDNKSQLASDAEWVATGQHFHALGFDVNVKQFIPTAFPDDKGGWVPNEHHGLPAAYVEVTAPGKATQQGWITSGIAAVGIPPHPMVIDDEHFVGLLEPQPKAFRSHLTINDPAQKAAVLEVNQPVRIGGWQLYQSSYDVSMGGRTSIIQAVRDPALPVVYTGLACMVLGAFLALWFAPKRRDEENLPAEVQS